MFPRRRLASTCVRYRTAVLSILSCVSIPIVLLRVRKDFFLLAQSYTSAMMDRQDTTRTQSSIVFVSNCSSSRDSSTVRTSSELFRRNNSTARPVCWEAVSMRGMTHVHSGGEEWIHNCCCCSFAAHRLLVVILLSSSVVFHNNGSTIGFVPSRKLLLLRCQR